MQSHIIYLEKHLGCKRTIPEFLNYIHKRDLVDFTV